MLQINQTSKEKQPTYFNILNLYEPKTTDFEKELLFFFFKEKRQGETEKKYLKCRY